MVLSNAINKHINTNQHRKHKIYLISKKEVMFNYEVKNS